MIDDRSNDTEWLAERGYIMLDRSPDLPEAHHAPGVTNDLWTFLHKDRQLAMRGDLSKLEDAYAANATIIRLKAIAERTGKVIGRPKPPGPQWTEEERAAQRDRAKAQGLGRRDRVTPGDGQ
jgi:hypothetical protein